MYKQIKPNRPSNVTGRVSVKYHKPLFMPVPHPMECSTYTLSLRTQLVLCKPPVKICFYNTGVSAEGIIDPVMTQGYVSFNSGTKWKPRIGFHFHV